MTTLLAMEMTSSSVSVHYLHPKLGYTGSLNNEFEAINYFSTVTNNESGPRGLNTKQRVLYPSGRFLKRIQDSFQT